MSLNSVNIMGNLTRDPELKYTPSGKTVCSLSLANNRVYTKNGEKTTEVSYFDVEVWGAAAENCNKYLTKGSGIIVEGRLRQDRWEKDGKTQSRVRIIANSIHFMPKKTGAAGGGQGAPAAGQQPAPAGEAEQSEPAAQPADAVAWDE
ncbi:MAG: single-stranded DNA-binding protein [Candidatus Omnitrophica bacterium]|nr:single-stranded DNA-binding protein [Candidatus Omnitrophota bacterium]